MLCISAFFGIVFSRCGVQNFLVRAVLWICLCPIYSDHSHASSLRPLRCQHGNGLLSIFSVDESVSLFECCGYGTRVFGNLKILLSPVFYSFFSVDLNRILSYKFVYKFRVLIK